jgi:hypothetical protein
MRGNSSLEMGGISIESYGQERIEKKISAVRPAHIKKTGLKIEEDISLMWRGRTGVPIPAYSGTGIVSWIL